MGITPRPSPLIPHPTLRASFAKPPDGGYTEPPRRFRKWRPQFSTAGRPGATLPLGRGQRPWVEAAQNVRQLEVAGFVCQAPWRGLQLTAPGGFATEGRSFQRPAVAGPNALRPRSAFVGGSRTERPATGRCGLHLPSPLTGAALNRPGGFATEGRSFQLQAASRAQRPRPRPASVGGSRTKRPATGRCGLRLPSPLAGAAPNRPRRFRFTEGRSFQLPAVAGPTNKQPSPIFNSPQHMLQYPQPTPFSWQRSRR